jgi:hypothetical protein
MELTRGGVPWWYGMAVWKWGALGSCVKRRGCGCVEREFPGDRTQDAETSPPRKRGTGGSESSCGKLGQAYKNAAGGSGWDGGGGGVVFPQLHITEASAGDHHPAVHNKPGLCAALSASRRVPGVRGQGHADGAPTVQHHRSHDGKASSHEQASQHLAKGQRAKGDGQWENQAT